jgi:hypothetical protein
MSPVIRSTRLLRVLAASEWSSHAVECAEENKNGAAGLVTSGLIIQSSFRLR